MSKKIDGVIEAVRYKNGQLMVVRAYERRGTTFSDLVLLERKTLLDRLQKGQQYFTGSRQEFRASTFKVGKPVLIVKLDGRELLATHKTAIHDILEEVPVF
jgi:hypothetical protein